MRCRKNLSELTPDEKESLKLAFLKLKDGAAFPSTNASAQAEGAASRYDDYKKAPAPRGKRRPAN